MLLELAIGDAYGAGFEYASELILQHNNLSGYIQHPRHQGIKPGCYTDDTQMSLAIAEAIVAGDEWTPQRLASRFVECFHRDPREGYASRFYKFLKVTRTGEEFIANIRPYSDKSGAAMRAAPIGVFPRITEVMEKAAIQAKLTHNTPSGVSAAQAAALMAHYFIYQLGDKSNLGNFLDKMVLGYSWGQPWVQEVGSKGWMSVRAAVTAVMGNNRLSELLRNCIAFGGDVDTVATIALGAASCTQEIEHDLPLCLVDGLENRTYGREYIQKLDTLLMQVVQS